MEGGVPWVMACFAKLMCRADEATPTSPACFWYHPSLMCMCPQYFYVRPASSHHLFIVLFTHTHMRAHSLTHTHTCAHTLLHTHTCAHFPHTHTHMCTHSPTHTHMCTLSSHTHTHMCTHSPTHTLQVVLIEICQSSLLNCIQGVWPTS